MSRDVRVLAQWCDDPTEAPLTVDLRIDPEDGAVVGRWDVFGAFDLNGKNCRPFILRDDGSLEFGDGAHGKHPPTSTNIRETPIRVGGNFRVCWNEEDSGLYRIVKVAVLGAKDGVP